MNTSSRFAVAIHVLTLLTYYRDEPLTSEFIAKSVNTNPVVIRRSLGVLRDAHLVTSQSGNGGGWQLLRAPEAITLGDVYRAVETQALFPLPAGLPASECVVGRSIQHTLAGYFKEVEEVLEERLAQKTIAQVLESVLSWNE